MGNFARNQRLSQANKLREIEREHLNRIMDENTLPCNTCHNRRSRLNFDQLPDKEKSHWEKQNDQAEYYLYCSHCKESSMIYKSEIF